MCRCGSGVDKRIDTIGVRAYSAARILTRNGFARVSVYPGGTRFYRSLHREDNALDILRIGGSR